MRFRFDSDYKVVENVVQMRPLSCGCYSDRVGEECIIENEENQWKDYQLELKNSVLNEDENEEIDD